MTNHKWSAGPAERLFFNHVRLMMIGVPPHCHNCMDVNLALAKYTQIDSLVGAWDESTAHGRQMIKETNRRKAELLAMPVGCAGARIVGIEELETFKKDRLPESDWDNAELSGYRCGKTGRAVILIAYAQDSASRKKGFGIEIIEPLPDQTPETPPPPG